MQILRLDNFSPYPLFIWVLVYAPVYTTHPRLCPCILIATPSATAFTCRLLVCHPLGSWAGWLKYCRGSIVTQWFALLLQKALHLMWACYTDELHLSVLFSFHPDKEKFYKVKCLLNVSLVSEEGLFKAGLCSTYVNK